MNSFCLSFFSAVVSTTVWNLFFQDLSAIGVEWGCY